VEGFPADRLDGFGRETGFRILPYNKHDRYSRTLTDLDIPAIRDTWFSGGIEWNIGHFGHTVHTCSPVFVGIPQPSTGPKNKL
jgi:hypothetical protein